MSQNIEKLNEKIKLAHLGGGEKRIEKTAREEEAHSPGTGRLPARRRFL
jgi:hypothetical protein